MDRERVNVYERSGQEKGAQKEACPVTHEEIEKVEEFGQARELGKRFNKRLSFKGCNSPEAYRARLKEAVKSFETSFDEEVGGCPITVEEINALTDLRGAKTLSKKFNPNVSLKGCKDLEACQKRLKLAFESFPEKEKYAQNLKAMIEKRRTEDQQNRATMIQYFQRLKNIMSSVDHDATMRQHIESTHSGVKPDEEIDQIVSKLSKVGDKLIVAGQTSSGKSTLLNAFLSEKLPDNQPLLPSHTLPCTSAICEVVYSDKCSAAVMNGGTVQPIKFEERKNYIYSSKDRRVQQDAVKLRVPSVMLNTGITLVDTPGIGESAEMSDVLHTYVRENEPFGFIFTIASATAGGVLPKFTNMLKELSDLSVHEDDFGQKKFNPRCCIFVANFWDRVPDGDKASTKQHIFDTLSKLHCMDNFNSSKQVFMMSATLAYECLLTGVIREDYSQFIDGLGNFIWREQKRKLKVAYRTLENKLKRLLHPLRSFIKRMKQSQRARDKDRAENTKVIDDLEKRFNAEIESFKKQFEERKEQCSKKLLQYLNTEASKEIDTWKLNVKDLPEAVEVTTKNVEKLQVKLHQIIYAKISDLLKEWENKEAIICTAQKDLLSSLVKATNRYTTELDELEVKLRSSSGDSEIVIDPISPIAEEFKMFKFPVSDDLDESMEEWKTRGLDIIACNPDAENLLESISIGPVMKVLEELKTDPKAMFSGGLEEFHSCSDEKKKRYMKQVATNTLATLCNDKCTSALTLELLTSVDKYIKLCEKETLKIIDVNRKLLHTLAFEMRSNNDVNSLYLPIENEVATLLEDVLAFGRGNIIEPNYQTGDIEINLEEQSSSLFATLIHGRLSDAFVQKYKRQTTSTNVYKVTLKMLKLKASQKAQQEVYLMKYSARSKDLVRYLGTYNLLGDLVLILHGNLMTARDYFFKYQPQTMGAMKTEFLVYLVSALEFLHLKNLVHVEVSLDSILIKENQKEICPLLSNLLEPSFLPITTDDVPLGGYLHLPPEVLQCTQPYAWQADMYGLGVIMIELFYEQDVFCEFKSKVQLKEWMSETDKLSALLNEAKLKAPAKQMNAAWEDLIGCCLAEEHSKRINVTEWHSKWMPIFTETC